MSDTLKWVLGIVLAAGLWATMSFNGHVSRQADVKATFSEVGNQYKRQAELVPNLTATVQGAAAQEKSVFTAVAEARAAATKMNVDLGALANNPEALKAFLQNGQALAGALTKLVATAEAYPQLKSIGAFKTLQTQLEGTQNRIGVARGRYIVAVRNYNAGLSTFPSRITANFGGFTAWPEFEATADEMKTPTVKF